MGVQAGEKDGTMSSSNKVQCAVVGNAEMNLPSDWKDFVIKYKWAQLRLLRSLFPDFNDYDMSNWLKYDSVRSILKRSEWKLGEKQTKENILKILKSMWQYYLHDECNFDINHPDIVESLIFHTLNRKSPVHSSLVSTRYLSRINPKIDRWLSKGYTIYAYGIMHIYPGWDWCQSRFLRPEMFLQSGQDLELEEVLALMENIWLRHIKKIPITATIDDINFAKEIFCARYLETGFITSRDWMRYGVSLKMAKNSHVRLSSLLANKFGIDLGINLGTNNDKSWNSQKFRLQNPGLPLDKCRYTGSLPADLHHLLDRANFPEYTYHAENVVPLDPGVHACITRRKWTPHLEKEYQIAMRAWRDAPDGRKMEVFDSVMERIVRHVRGEE